MRFSSERRTAASSSTTNTTASASLKVRSPPSELKDGAVWRLRCRPQPPSVSFDNRAADRRPHAQTVRLRSIKGFEQTVATLRLQPRPRIAHGDQVRPSVQLPPSVPKALSDLRRLHSWLRWHSSSD